MQTTAISSDKLGKYLRDENAKYSKLGRGNDRMTIINIPGVRNFFLLFWEGVGGGQGDI